MNAINCLQEYCQKTFIPFPKYDMVKHETTSNMNIFTIRVTVESLTAEGTALNKKSAKCRAAEKMIMILKNRNCKIDFQPSMSNSNSLNSTPEKSSSSNLYSLDNTPERISLGNYINVPDLADAGILNTSRSLITEDVVVNAVGKLQEFCAKRNLKMPQYSDEVGYFRLEHKVICKIGDMSEEGIGKTKKQAKHVCAEKMWHRLVKLFGCSAETIGHNSENLLVKQMECLTIDNPIDIKASVEKAKMLYSKIQQDKNFVMDPKNIPIKDYYSYLKHSLDPEKLTKLHEYSSRLVLGSCNDIEKLSSILNDICTILAVKLKEITLKTNNREKYAVAYSINTVPVCTQIGISNTYNGAKLQATIFFIQTIFKLVR